MHQGEKGRLLLQIDTTAHMNEQLYSFIIVCILLCLAEEN
jgi:hypothetical protein